MLFIWLCNVRRSFLSVSRLVFDFIHKFCYVTAHDEIFGNLPLLGDSLSRVSPVHHESSLRTLRTAHFRREEVLHDEGQLVASYPKKSSQVSLIDRAPQLHFSTLEKTKIDHNPLLNNLVVLLQEIFQDLDFHTRSSPGFDEVEDETNEGVLAVKFIISLDLAVTRSPPDPCWARFCYCSGASCRTEMANVKQGQQMIPFITCEVPFG